ncbi:uncharacterized protein F5891DRAFT_1204284 [Suillus fuscotomentosus]|uniref:Uncharacterized protein n=1 Tax=Suillus fuscotomentosus TaxID=1912939 RepID=A0AAD4HBH0_9AGAM|nr:uncharacterized protein F5891DRAFT_1204284 [Suillus fuscotomentosus]KAG1881013.1 hypothetical protein F5891DRAFT_1204284 [Suillus fuscotomentosus]
MANPLGGPGRKRSPLPPPHAAPTPAPKGKKVVPQLNLSPSPHQLPPRFENRHRHSLSLARPPLHKKFYIPSASFNLFGPNAILGSDRIETNLFTEPFPVPIEGIHAPQGRVPVSVPSLIPPGISRESSRPDFIRGFGLDIPEEEELPEEEVLADTYDNAAIDIDGQDSEIQGEMRRQLR